MGSAQEYKRINLDGTKVYILGDSNTVAHSQYWDAWAKKNFPASRIDFKARKGAGIHVITEQLEVIDPKTTRMVIIGSLGGNDAQGLKNRDFEAELSPGGPYFKRVIEPLMEELKRLQDAGVKIAFFGLPFGRETGEIPKANDKREMARLAMDAALVIAASSYTPEIPYETVFDATKAIKGSGGGGTLFRRPSEGLSKAFSYFDRGRAAYQRGNCICTGRPWSPRALAFLTGL